MQAPSALATEPTVALTPAPESHERTAPEAPSAPATPEDAAKSGDAKAFREMRHQERVDQIEGKKTVTVKEHERTVASKPESADKAPKKKSLEGRTAAVDAEVAELRQKLAIRDELRRQAAALETKPAPAPEPPKVKRSNWADHPDAPKLEDFQDYETYLDARAEFIADRRYEQRMGERDQQTAQQREVAQTYEGVTRQAATFKERVEGWRKDHADAEISPELLDIMPASAIRAANLQRPRDQQERIGPEHFIVEQIFRSEHPGPLLAHLSNPDAFQRLYTLAHTQDGAAAVVRAIGALEHQLSTPASPAPSPSARVSTLPNPPTVLGGKAAVLDPLKQAVKAGDARVYKQLRHQERVARFAR